MAMDQKPAKSKSKLLKFLPKSVSFQNPPFSPSRDHKRSDNANKLKTHLGRGFSGPIISMIPVEARRKSKNSSFEAQEPTSPKVSCMGQIKLKHKQKHNNKNIKQTKKIVSLPKDFKTVSSHPEVKKKSSSSSSSSIRNIFGGAKPSRKSDASADKPPLPARAAAPGLSQMRRFASSRDAFANFDWSAPQIAPVDSDHRNYYSDEERGDSDGEEEEVIIPFSAPILVGGGGGGGVAALEPRKEINLWKRRTMSKPIPLQVNTLVVSK